MPLELDQDDPDLALRPGACIADRFVVEAVIGTGASSIVCRARDLLSDRRIALKVLRARLSRGSVAAARLEREAELVARLDHPAVVRLRASGWLPSGRPWLALELLVGETLERTLAREGALPLGRAAALLGDVLEGLAAAHERGVLHRDLKPANLFVIHDDGAGPEAKERCVLLDFGVGLDLLDPRPRLTAPRGLVGTLAYLAPEQLRPGAEAGPRADLWAVGVVAYRALTGQAPFGAFGPHLVARIETLHPPPPSSLVPGLDGQADAFFASALAKDPAARFEDALEMRRALAALAAGTEPAPRRAR
jgi:eukaryotic-like serine/threonine-protein kinase